MPWRGGVGAIYSAGLLSYRLPIDGLNPPPKPQSSLGIELGVPTTVVVKKASMACRDIQFQKTPNAAQDFLTKLCPQVASQVAAPLESATAYWDRRASGEVRQVGSTKPC
jgi:hypothetical protein